MSVSDERPIIEVAGVSKRYRLGSIGAASLRDAAQEWWAKLWRKEEALAKPSDGQAPRNAPGSKDFWALRDISFTVKPGEVVGILGRNGAGKSTLLKILSRITEPTSGRAVMRGRVASLLEVGTGFHPDLSGRENIFLNGAILGMRRAEILRRFDEIVDFAEIGPFIETPVKRYSSGMYTRLAFAIAAHLEAEILIVDEVLAVGDSSFQKKCMGKMQGVANAGRTVLFVSHNLVAMEQLCRRCLYIAEGRLRTQGPSREVIAEYQRDFGPSGDQTFDSSRIRSDGRVELHSYHVTNSEGQEYPIAATNETLQIHVRVTVKEGISHPACGISVWNSQGVNMISITSVDHGQELPALPAGDWDLTVSLRDVPFTPGAYTASFWVMSPQWYVYACAEAAIAFEVGQSSVFGTKDVDYRYGCVYVPVDYTWKPHNGNGPVHKSSGTLGFKAAPAPVPEPAGQQL